MPIVTEDSWEIERMRMFHDGPFGRCPRCGRKVFLPCLACAVELEGDVNDPLDTAEEEPLRVELDGDQRQRYEYCRLEKIAEAVRREDDEFR